MGKWLRKRLVGLSVATGLWLAAGGISFGQATYSAPSWEQARGRYTAPLQPQLSPYLNLLRNDSSALSPYHSFVQPRRQQLQAFQQQASRLDRLERVTASPHPTRGQPSTGRLPTGSGSYFQSYLHFYPGRRPDR